jgi:hypothetical protein
MGSTRCVRRRERSCEKRAAQIQGSPRFDGTARFNCSPANDRNLRDLPVQPGPGEGRLTTQLSRSRRVSRTAGVGHLHPFAASSPIGCRAPIPAIRGTEMERQGSVESECGAGGFRSTISVAAPFVWRCLTSSPVVPVSTPRSSNRTCRSPASGSRTRPHAFTHDGPRPSCVRRTSRKCP